MRKHSRRAAFLVFLTGCFVAQLLSPAYAAAANPKISSISPTQGIAGAKVTLRGTGFGSSKGKVRFGSVSAKIRTWGSKTVSVIVPTGSGSVKIALTTARHRKSNSKNFVYQSVVASGDYRVFPVNDLGMHCVDDNFSVLSMLPPFNVVNAQVVSRTGSTPLLLDNNSVELSYSAVPDVHGSINSKSTGKTNFWTYANSLFGVTLSPGVGLTGLAMPADAVDPTQTTFRWDSALNVFTANGVPIIPKDDSNTANRYPLLRVTAKSKTSGAVLASTDVVLPVSEETTCATCHQTGRAAALSQGPTWATNSDKELESRLNILLLHDFRSGTNLSASQPVLCASCHYSTALDLAGTGPSVDQQTHSTMSRAMHSFHASRMFDPDGAPFTDAPSDGTTPTTTTRQSCYTCHPGVQTKCLRGAMSEKLNCQNCHGDMAAVGGDNPLQNGGSIDGTTEGQRRRPWRDLPRCQSCHTGDAVQHHTAPTSDMLASDGLRFILGYLRSDSSASPLTATNLRFAEQPNKLFRHSKGHGGLLCEACHGSTHAIWPNADSAANDNETAKDVQGHAGVIAECSTCHKSGSLPASLGGPHGLHPIGDQRFANGGHEHLYESNRSSCQACHGQDYRGTALSKALAARTFSGLEDVGTKQFAKGQIISCYSCHNGPGGGD